MCLITVLIETNIFCYFLFPLLNQKLYSAIVQLTLLLMQRLLDLLTRNSSRLTLLHHLARRSSQISKAILLMSNSMSHMYLKKKVRVRNNLHTCDPLPHKQQNKSPEHFFTQSAYHKSIVFNRNIDLSLANL